MLRGQDTSPPRSVLRFSAVAEVTPGPTSLHPQFFTRQVLAFLGCHEFPLCWMAFLTPCWNLSFLFPRSFGPVSSCGPLKNFFFCLQFFISLAFHFVSDSKRKTCSYGGIAKSWRGQETADGELPVTRAPASLLLPQLRSALLVQLILCVLALAIFSLDFGVSSYLFTFGRTVWLVRS